MGSTATTNWDNFNLCAKFSKSHIIVCRLQAHRLTENTYLFTKLYTNAPHTVPSINRHNFLIQKAPFSVPRVVKYQICRIAWSSTTVIRIPFIYSNCTNRWRDLYYVIDAIGLCNAFLFILQIYFNFFFEDLPKSDLPTCVTSVIR